jgi:hypothetical protein
MKLLSIHVSPSSVASALLFRNILFSTLFAISCVCVLHLCRKVKLNIHRKQLIKLYCNLLTCLTVNFLHPPDPKMMQVAASLGLQRTV